MDRKSSITALMRIKAIIKILFGLLIALEYSCNDPLPTYQEPQNVLKANIAALNVPTDTITYNMVDNNNPNLARVNLTSPPHGFEVRIVNIYEETIQDDAEVQGTLSLQWRDQPQFQSDIPIELTSIYSSHYDPATGIITINPGDTLLLHAYWYFKFTTNEWIFSKQNGIDGPPITGRGNFYRFHNPMEFRAKLKLKVFRSLSFVESESENDVVVNFKGLIIPPP